MIDMNNGPVKLEFKNLANSNNEKVAWLLLSREEAANSFNAEMMKGITDSLQSLSQRKDVRALVIMGRGKHFSAGADLTWMKESAQLNYDENIKDAERLTKMFEGLYNLPIPTIGVLHGAVFGGAVGLTACCDIVLAEHDSKFCLSEVRLGLLPAVIYPYLAKRIHLGQLKRLSLTGRVFNGEEALDVGLVDRVFTMTGRDQVVLEELNLILSAGPEATRALKSLHLELEKDSFQQSQKTAIAIAKARTSPEGQAGLSSYFKKEGAPWSVKIDDVWK